MKKHESLRQAADSRNYHPAVAVQLPVIALHFTMHVVVLIAAVSDNRQSGAQTSWQGQRL